jgi:tetratricopeptide (TPR) repeat protein
LLNEHNPWAHHTLSHIYLKRGLIREGIDLLEHYAPSWSQYSHIIESHNLWHLALLYFENLEFDKVQEVYQRADWRHQSQFVSEEIDAAALLWRLDFEDQEDFASPLWRNLAQSINNHAEFGGMPFLSAQLCYALQRGQQEQRLSEALAKIEEFVLEQEKEDRFVWKDVGLPLIYGSLAFANKQYEDALQHFEPIIDKVGCVGGSDAQIDLFYLTYLRSLIRANRFEEAETLLLRITQGRNLTKLEQKWLAECR